LEGRYLTAVIFVGLSLMALRAQAIEVSINIAGLPDTALSSTDVPLGLNDFTTLSVDGNLVFEAFLSSGKAIASAGNFAFFDFAYGVLIVKSVTISAPSNASVTAAAFDGADLVVDQQVSDNFFSTPLLVSSSGGISRLQVRLLKSEITVMSIELGAVPLPTPILLLASAVLGVAGVRRFRGT
jgi:hypothetical protein